MTVDQILEAVEDPTMYDDPIYVQLAAEVRRLQDESDQLRQAVNTVGSYGYNEICKLRKRERVLVEALTWYERWVGECNKDGMEGDTARGRLARDIGKTASAALEAVKE
jgi:hypothetical protein